MEIDYYDYASSSSSSRPHSYHSINLDTDASSSSSAMNNFPPSSQLTGSQFVRRERERHSRPLQQDYISWENSQPDDSVLGKLISEAQNSPVLPMREPLLLSSCLSFVSALWILRTRWVLLCPGAGPGKRVWTTSLVVHRLRSHHVVMNLFRESARTSGREIAPIASFRPSAYIPLQSFIIIRTFPHARRVDVRVLNTAPAPATLPTPTLLYSNQTNLYIRT